MSLVNQYSRTFVGQSIANSWQFYLPQIPRQNNDNYFEIEVVQLGIRRPGTSAPHEVLFFAADIQGVNGGFITNKGMIDSQICLGTVQNYDSGAIVAQLTAPAPITFKIPSFQPFNPFTARMFRLGQQELANEFTFTAGNPSSPICLVPIGVLVNAQFIGGIGVTTPGSGSGTNLTVTAMVSPSNNLAVGQTITMDGFAAVTITALVSGTGGTGTYTVSSAQDTGSQKGLSTTLTDTVTPSQFIMTWNIKEMSPK
jgi:hypothetical protein